MDNPRHKEVVEGYISCYNNFDIDGMMSFLSDAVVFENESAGEINARAEGKAEFRALAEQSAGLFSSRIQEVTNMEVNRNEVVAHVLYKAVLAVDLPNGLNAGEPIELAGRSEFRLEDGKISYVKDISCRSLDLI